MDFAKRAADGPLKSYTACICTGSALLAEIATQKGRKGNGFVFDDLEKAGYETFMDGSEEVINQNLGERVSRAT